LVREVDVQPSHPSSSLHRCEFGFLFSKKKIDVGASPTAFPSKKRGLTTNKLRAHAPGIIIKKFKFSKTYHWRTNPLCAWDKGA
jgi:hypothetical protein